MPGCSIIGCRTKQVSKPAGVTLHRLPVIEPRRSKWLETIGVENIDTTKKHIYVCSLHFEASCFNRTMNIVKLRDGALPSQALLPLTRLKTSDIMSERDQNAVASASVYDIQFVNMPHSNPEYMPPTRCVAENEPRTITGVISKDGVANISDDALHIINKLKAKIQKQVKHIKRLNEKIRRQGKKIANITNIMKELKQRNSINMETADLVESCVLKRQISKDKGLPLEGQYSEDIRKSAITLG
ncbi:THAP domain-containing protein 1-like [Spodoptera litura]|uniref:THAP domain-containing protein 1-like n=1 Tax=Spodoptera litura TaxID=69820 RepID=A0A9J7IM90_SPOLT|nr:THAP domain-containing protein 1-like [Spodoptera litura]